MQLSKNFDSSEFECKCGCGLVNMNFTFILYLQAMRDFFGKPMIVTSGMRCKQHNQDLGGSRTSQHLQGKAADIKVHNSQERFQLVDAAIKAGFKRIGLYYIDGGQGHIHVDTKAARPIIWTGISK